MTDAVERAVADAHRREWAAVLAATVRLTRDLDAAEEAVQEAYVAALTAWRRDGVPERPGAWLLTVARRQALNVLARSGVERAKLPLLIEPADAEPPAIDAEAPAADAPAAADAEPEALTDPDDRLRLIFLCCHPALAPEAQAALTLRLVCGVATADVAHLLLVAPATMAARLTRAKRKIAAAGIPFAVPPPARLPERLDAALTVVHLLAAAGHTAPSGERLQRDEAAERALDLARTLHALLPQERETAGLLALLLVHHARRATRTDADGNLVRLEQQDRTRWDRAA